MRDLRTGDLFVFKLSIYALAFGGPCVFLGSKWFDAYPTDMYVGYALTQHTLHRPGGINSFPSEDVEVTLLCRPGDDD